MSKLSRRTLLLLLAYLITSIGLTVIVILRQSRHPEPVRQGHEEKGKQSNKLGPHELFFLDRNYPEGDSGPGIFQERLAQAIAFDKSDIRSHRGLDHPWNVEGPGNLGGRVNAIAVHPTDPGVVLLGYSQGGIYRTSDGGENWNPVFDDHTSQAISHIQFDLHQPHRVWAVTGDINISGYPFLGSGVYLSEDAGTTWQYKGLKETGVLSKVAVDLYNPNVIYVGSMGYPSQKGNERGLFRSTDGGETWEKTLTIDDSTGVIDLVTDPSQEGRIFASTYTRLRSSIKSTTIGVGTALYKSDDFGATWTSVTNGLPDGEHSRTSVEITYNGTLFISYIGDVAQGECEGFSESLQAIYKSNNGGMSWDTVPISPIQGLYCELFGEFGWYFEVLKVNPSNPLDMFLLGVDIFRTLDGGQSWFEAAPTWWTYEVHADKHDLVYAHDEIYLATDGGAYKTDIHQTAEWIDIENIPATQFYRTTWNPHIPDQYYGGAQDNGTTGGNDSFINEWPRILGGDGFQPLFDPAEPTWMYALTQNGSVYFSEDGGLDFDGLNKGLKGSRYWDMPFVMSPHDSKILFCGSYKMFRMDMRDSVREWKELSQDMTRGDTILNGRYPAITAIAQSELDELRLYAGTQDGLIWTTADGGVNWTNISEGTPGHYVTSITCSTVHPEGVIATYSGYRDNDHQPYIYRSLDAGENWEPIVAELPMLGVNNLFILPGWDDAVLFAATDGGVYISLDGGEKWERLGSNMPYMPVYDLDYNPVENTLVAATFARGIMTFPVDELDLISATKEIPVNGLSAISIYPTMIDDQFTIDYSGFSGDHRLKVNLTNSSGVSMEEFYIPSGQGKKHDVILGDEFTPGLYLVSVSTLHEQRCSKIIIL